MVRTRAESETDGFWFARKLGVRSMRRAALMRQRRKRGTTATAHGEANCSQA